jgi:hypothetical protein
MSNEVNSTPTRRPQPITLVRGFGGLGIADESGRVPGFNDGTVYPQKRGENYIYEGLILRFLKSNWEYQDATNVVGYYSQVVKDAPPIPDELKNFEDFLPAARSWSTRPWRCTCWRPPRTSADRTQPGIARHIRT